jgi:hypothetical protein
VEGAAIMTKQERDTLQAGGFRTGELQGFTSGIGVGKSMVTRTDIGRIREELYVILERLMTLKGETQVDELGLNHMFNHIDSAISESKGITTL